MAIKLSDLPKVIQAYYGESQVHTIRAGESSKGEWYSLRFGMYRHLWRYEHHGWRLVGNRYAGEK